MGSIFIIFIQSRALPLVEIHCETVLSLDEIVILLRQLLYSSSYIPQRQLKSLKVQCEGPLSPFTVAQGWFRGKKRIYKRRWRHKSNDPTHIRLFMSSPLCLHLLTVLDVNKVILTASRENIEEKNIASHYLLSLFKLFEQFKKC